MAEVKYRWANAYEWFSDFLDKQDPWRVKHIAKQFAQQAGFDAIQENFQDEMDDDGFFTPVWPHPLHCHICDEPTETNCADSSCQEEKGHVSNHVLCSLCKADIEPKEKRYRIQYKHIDCPKQPHVEWEDEWDSPCNSPCPACGTKEIEPMSWQEKEV